MAWRKVLLLGPALLTFAFFSTPEKISVPELSLRKWTCEDRLDPTALLPLRSGQVWIYRTDDQLPVEMAVEPVQSHSGTDTWRVRGGLWSPFVDDLQLQQTERGLVSLSRPLAAGKEVTLIPAGPWWPGQSWSLGEQAGAMRIVGQETIVGPMGEHQTWHLEWRQLGDGGAVVRDFWLTPGLGIVKATAWSETRPPLHLELVKLGRRCPFEWPRLSPWTEVWARLLLRFSDDPLPELTAMGPGAVPVAEAAGSTPTAIALQWSLADLELQLEAPAWVYQGDPVVVIPRIHNRGSAPVWMLRAIDGSWTGRQSPRIHFWVGLDPLLDLTVPLKTMHSDCGIHDWVSGDDFVEVHPGESFDPLISRYLETEAHLAVYAPIPESLKIRMTYDLRDLAAGDYVEELRRSIDRVPPILLEATVVVEVLPRP